MEFVPRSTMLCDIAERERRIPSVNWHCCLNKDIKTNLFTENKTANGFIFRYTKHEFKKVLAPLCRCCSFGVKITISIHMLWFFLPLVIYGLSTYSPHTACSPGGEKPNHMLIPWFSSILKALMTRHVLRLILPVCSSTSGFHKSLLKFKNSFTWGERP